MLSTNTLRYGSDEPLDIPCSLRAGPFSLSYEAGDLRYIRLDGVEVVRRIYVAVRDQNWGTVGAQITNEQIEAGADSFRISYDVANRRGDIDFTWRGVITGEADGTIHFAMDGTAHSTFLANRIGFCVLHPASCAGARCRIEHVDGSVENSHFPQTIAPQRVENGQIHPVYPFAEMRALAHEVAPGVWAETRFAGEVFELEDQRNWIDGSYKTYGTPLHLPFPTRIAANTSIRQSVTLSLHAKLTASNEQQATDQRRKTKDESKTIANQQPSSFFLLPSSSPLPAFGVGVASHEQPLSPREIERLRLLGPAHVRVDLHLAEPSYLDTLHQAIEQARALHIPLEAALFFSDDAEGELVQLRNVLDKHRPPIARWLVFHTNEKSTATRWIKLARAKLSDYDATVPFASGTNVYFTELNRERPDATALDHIVYSVNPQVHAFDNASLVECTPTIGTTIESARTWSGGKPIVISPVTLKPRFNPVATGPQPKGGPGELPPEVDMRQMSLFGACWTLAAVKYLAESGVASATLYETTGWRGVMETESGSPSPFPSLPGCVFPLYHILADINAFAGGAIVHSQSSDPLAVEGLVLRKGGAIRIVVANMTNTIQRVKLDLPLSEVTVRMLHERTALYAMESPEQFRADPGELMTTQHGMLELELLPYATARLDAVETAS